MKIAILSRYQNKVQRGVETFVLELSKRLEKNHHVEILVGADSDSLTKVLKGKYDLVMPLNGRLQALKMSLGRLIGGYKLVIGGHSGIGRDDILNIVLAKPDLFVALTEFQAKWARKWAWGSKIVKISNGIDLNRFSPNGKKKELGLKKPIILSVGALTWYKHHERVIEATSLTQIGSVLILGDGDMKDKLKEKGKEKLGSRFRIMKVNYEELPAIYRSVDVFTLPSWEREAFGIVYLEAMASGLGVVAPDDESRREIVGKAGLFVDTSDRAKYMNALIEAINKNWEDIPRKQAEKYSWEKVAKEYEDCFKQLV